MPVENQQFYLKVTSTSTGQAANITGQIIAVPSGTSTPTAAWTEISPGFYTSPISLLQGEYIADITVPWASNLYTFSIFVDAAPGGGGGGGGGGSSTISYGTIIS